MSQLLIQGGRRLDGEVRIQGAKNSVLPILAATLLTGGQVLVQNCPHLRDVEASVQILRTLGCTARWEAGGLLVDTAQVSGCTISDRLMREMRSSAIFLGAILARCGQAEISYPGGCGASWDQTCQKRAECFRALLIVRGLPYRGKHTPGIKWDAKPHKALQSKACDPRSDFCTAKLRKSSARFWLYRDAGTWFSFPRR